MAESGNRMGFDIDDSFTDAVLTTFGAPEDVNIEGIGRFSDLIDNILTWAKAGEGF